MTAPASLTSAQRARAEALFAEALEHEAPVRERWVAQAAEDDPAVLREVGSLLRGEARAGRFLTESLGSVAAALFAAAGPEGRDAFSAAGIPSSGTVAESEGSAAPLVPGQTVGPYTIEREIGRGGMGRVYLARDARLNRSVALKALAPRLAERPAEQDRFRREAVAAAALAHPGICTIFAFEEIDGRLYIVSEFVEGRTLRQEMAAALSPPAAADVLAVARDLAAALAAAHARGIAHRDLKPENVMRAADGRVKVLDFGLAKREGPEGLPGHAFETVPGALVGTPAYMAPEQLQGQRGDSSSDVFAFGVLVYEYAVGRHPFEAETPIGVMARVIEAPAASLASQRRDLPAAFTAVVDRCLAKQPGDRYRSAVELAQAFQPLGAIEAAPASEVLSSLGALQAEASLRGPDQPVPLSAWWRRHQVTVMLLYGLAVVVGWEVKEWTGGGTTWVFLAVAAAGTISGVFRGHLLFSDRANHGRFRRELRRARPVTAVADALVAIAVMADGLAVAGTRPVPAALLFGLGLGLGLARFVIEPSTESGAFGATS